jgi:transporter family-2 protein
MDQHRSQTLMLIGLAFSGGMFLPIQAIVNGRLAGYLGTPFLASTAQNLVGALAALSLALFFWPARVSLAQVAGTPVWAWTGGLMGMVYVLAGVIVAPRLGTTSLMAVVICGQLVSSLMLDQFGVLHERRAIDGPTLIGVALLFTGAVLILRRV